jgi:RHS repeat-associated protein
VVPEIRPAGTATQKGGLAPPVFFTLLVDQSQNVVASYRYDSFGTTMAAAASVAQPYQFSTKRIDEQTGLGYYGYRYYLPSSGRWLSRDPIGFSDGDINLYGFVQNNPVNMIDPDGRLAFLLPAVPPAVAALGKAAAYVGSAMIAGALIAEVIDDNTDMTDTNTWPDPPVDGPCQEGEPSRSKPRKRGEKSVYDDQGGEWRPHNPDKHHPEGHWDHKPPGNNQPWVDVDLNGNIIPK